MVGRRSSFLRQSLIVECMMSAIIVFEVQIGLRTCQVDLRTEVSEAFNDVASLKGPKEPSPEQSKLHAVCYTFSKKWPA